MLRFDPAAMALCQRVALEKKRYGRFQLRTIDFLAEAGQAAGTVAIRSACDLGWICERGHFLHLTAAGIYVSQAAPSEGAPRQANSGPLK